MLFDDMFRYQYKKNSIKIVGAVFAAIKYALSPPFSSGGPLWQNQICMRTHRITIGSKLSTLISFHSIQEESFSYFCFLLSIRQPNFSLFKLCLKEIVGWMFATNHYNYARCLPLFIHNPFCVEEETKAAEKKIEKGANKFLILNKSYKITSIILNLIF